MKNKMERWWNEKWKAKTDVFGEKPAPGSPRQQKMYHIDWPEGNPGFGAVVVELSQIKKFARSF
jgi:hypothetical protein